MANENDVVFKIKADHEEAKRQLEDFQRAIAEGFGPTITETRRLKEELSKVKTEVAEQTSVWDSLKGSLAAQLEVIGLVKSAIGGLVAFFREGSAAAKEQELAEVRLAAALKNRGDVTGDVFRSLKTFNEETAKTRPIEEAQLETLQRSLALRGIANENIEAATRVTLGLARVTGQDLQEASLGAAKIMEGNIGFLKRYGIEVDYASEAVEKLTKISEEATGQETTMAGATQMLTHEWAEFKKELFQTDGAGGIAIAIVQTLSMKIEELRFRVKALREGDLYQALGGNRALDSGIGTGMGDVKAAEAKAQREQEQKDAAELAAERKAREKEEDAERKERDARLKQEQAEAAREKLAAEKEASREYLDELKRGYEAEIKFKEGALKFDREMSKQKEELEKSNTAFMKEQIKERTQDLSKDKKSSEQIEQEFAQVYSQIMANEKMSVQEKNEAVKQAEDGALKSMRDNLGNLKEVLKDFIDGTKPLSDVLKSFGAEASQVMDKMFSDMIQSAVRGGESLLAIIGHAIGGLIVHVGEMLMEIGTAAMLASAIPFFGELFGGPVGFGTGAAAFAAGAAMVAVGTGMDVLMGGGAIGGASAPAAGGGGSGNGGSFAGAAGAVNNISSMVKSQSGPGAGFTKAGGGTINNVFQINFDRGFIAGNPKDVGRALMDIIRDQKRLSPGALRGG